MTCAPAVSVACKPRSKPRYRNAVPTFPHIRLPHTLLASSTLQTGLWDPANGTFNFFKARLDRSSTVTLPAQELPCLASIVPRCGRHACLQRTRPASCDAASAPSAPVRQACGRLECMHTVAYECPATSPIPVPQAFMEDGWRDPLANYIRVCILTQVRANASS